MAKKILIPFIFGIILLLHPVFLFGQSFWTEQADPLFSAMNRYFSGDTPGEQTLTPAEEYYLGRAVAANILAAYKPYMVNAELTNYVNLICQALAINADQPAAYNGYHVMILDSREINAFSTPGGHIFITKALIDIVPSEDALAGIIAHEMAHVMLKHGIKMINDMKLTTEADIMAQQAAAFAGNSGIKALSFRDSVNDLFTSIVKSGYSQPQEFEADNLAVKLLASAGYSPGGLLEMLNALKTVQGGQSNSIFATHPPTSERIANVQKQVSGYKVPDNSAARRERFLRVMGSERR